MYNKTIIIIAVYNAMPWIYKCLESTKPHGVVVVDNNSTDETVNFIQKKHPEVTLLRQSKNLGFGQANNLGISYALKQGADYVFLLNQDAYLENKTIEKLIAVHQNNQDFGILSPIHLNGSATNLDKNFSNYLNQNNKLIFDALKNKYSKDIYELPFVNAAAWLLPRKTFEIVGGFDPMFYHYAEDDNFCQRVLFHGLKIGVVPNTYIYHDREHKEAKKMVKQEDKLIVKERFFKHKWGNVNEEYHEEIKKYKKNQLKLIIKLVLKFKIKKANYYLSELKLIKEIVPEIEKSRKINSSKGKHYLS